MEWQRISAPEEFDADLRRLYTESFPPYERRTVDVQERMLSQADYYPLAARTPDGALVALLFYWQLHGMIYIEHLAVVPALRGGGRGSQLLAAWMEQQAEVPIVLEIDPPMDEISRRRQRFYRRLGFTANDYPYVHPSFDGERPHPLVLMSRPRPIGPDEYERFLRELHEKVLAEPLPTVPETGRNR